MTYRNDNIKARLMQPDGSLYPGKSKGRRGTPAQPERFDRNRGAAAA